MKTINLLLTFLLISSYDCYLSQQDTLKYWVKFTDKNHTVYNIEQPNSFLSQRAIDRRIKNQIPISEQDIPVNEHYIDSLRQFSTVLILNKSKWFNAVTISCWDTNTINEIVQFPFVDQAQIVMRHHLVFSEDKFEKIELPSALKSTPLFSNTSKFPYGLTYNQSHLHKIDYLHELGFHGEGIHIAVIDAGFEYVNGMNCFEHLFLEGRILSTKDFVEHDGDVFSDHYHGTAVLSTMAAIIPDQFFGTAIKASYHLLRSEAADYEHIVEEDNWIAAAEYADSAGVDIINTSLGYTEFDNPEQNHTYSELDGNTTRIAQAANIAANKGILLVTSAGNQGDGEWKYISTPADASLSLTVGAVDSLGNFASFSSVGPNSAGELKPNVVSVGWNCYVVLPWGEGIARANGTSFSSPMIAGMAATLWSSLPHLTNFELKALIESVGHQFNNPDSLQGYGIPNFYEAYTHVSGQIYTLQQGIELVNYFPNPTTDQFNLMIRSDRDQLIRISCYDLFGQELHHEDISIAIGMNKLSVTDFDFALGITLIKIQDELGKELIIRILKS